jgi:hypothetical protein
VDQVKIDFDYDDRVPMLAAEFGIVLAPRLATGTALEETKKLATRLALLASKRLARFDEPEEPIRCHTCDAETGPRDRVRVVVCPRCSLSGGSPGSDG